MKAKSRGNGQCCAYKRGDAWEAQWIVDYKPNKKGPGYQPVPIKKRKTGFAKKSDAIAYAMQMKGTKEPCKLTLQQIYDDWEPWYATRIDPQTLGCYRAAYKHFSALAGKKFIDITAADLQKCMDDCPSGHRTHQNMKVTASLLWKFGMDHEYVFKNAAENLFIGRGQSIQREPLTELEVQMFRKAIGKYRYAEYIYALCYLGFRPGEFLSLRKDHYRIMDGIEVLVNGSKTEAGKDRVVVIPPQVIDIVRSRLFVPGTDLLFPMYKFSRKGILQEIKPMTDEYFNKHVFKPLGAVLGVAAGKVPYSARHTYSDKLKAAEGSEKAKAGLMGHTDYAFTQSHYQSTDMDDLLAVAVSIE